MKQSAQSWINSKYNLLSFYLICTLFFIFGFLYYIIILYTSYIIQGWVIKSFMQNKFKQWEKSMHMTQRIWNKIGFYILPVYMNVCITEGWSMRKWDHINHINANIIYRFCENHTFLFNVTKYKNSLAIH